jgi:hypothetical protein
MAVATSGAKPEGNDYEDSSFHLETFQPMYRSFFMTT